jgi:hypothetical protein
MMFQIGDKVVCINGKPGVVTKDKVYSVHKLYGSHYIHVRCDSGGISTPLGNKRFVRARTLLAPPKTEIEWLDRVRDNFKD